MPDLPCPALPDPSPAPNASVAACEAWIHRRQHLGPKHLGEPGPDDALLRRLLAAAAAAPDHRQCVPWRFLVLGPQARHTLAEAFARSLLHRDPHAPAHAVDDARRKAFRGPVLLLAVARLATPEPSADPALASVRVPPWERLVSLGAALQNLLLAAQAHGFASGLTSGQALQDEALRQAFGLAADEQAVCFVNLGTALRQRAGRPRPAVDEFTQWWP